MQLQLVCEGCDRPDASRHFTIAFVFQSSVWRQSRHRGTLVNGLNLLSWDFQQPPSISFAVLQTCRWGKRRGSALLRQAGVFLLGTWRCTRSGSFCSACCPQERTCVGHSCRGFKSWWGGGHQWTLGGFPSLSRSVNMGRPQAAALRWSQVHRRTEPVGRFFSALCCSPPPRQANCFETPNLSVVPVCVAPPVAHGTVNGAAAELSERCQLLPIRDQPDSEVPQCLSRSHRRIISRCTANFIAALKKSWLDGLSVRSESNKPE